MNQSITKKITTITAFLMLMFSVNTFGQIQPDVPTDAPPIFEKTISDVVNGPYEKTIEFTQNEDEFTVFEIAGYGVNTYEILNGTTNLKEMQPYPIYGNYTKKNYLITSNLCKTCKITFGGIEKNTSESLIKTSLKVYNKGSNLDRFQAEQILQSGSETENINKKLDLLSQEILLRKKIGENIRVIGLTNIRTHRKATVYGFTNEDIEILENNSLPKNHPDYLYNESYKLLTIGRIFLLNRNVNQAIYNLKAAATILEEKGETLDEKILFNHHLAYVYTVLSQALLENKKYEEMLPIVEKAIRLSKENNDYGNLILSYNNLGALERQKHNLTKAISYHEKAIAVINQPEFIATSSKNASRSHLMRSYYYLSVVSAIKGRYYDAVKLIEHSEIIATDQNNNVWLAHIKAAKGRIFLELQQYEKSIAEYETSWRIYEEQNNQEELGVLSINLGRLYSEIGNQELALEYINKSYEIFSEPKDIEFKIKTNLALANANLLHNDNLEAIDIYNELLSIASKSNDLFLEGRTLTSKAQALIKIGSFKEALKTLNLAIQLQKKHNDILYHTKSNYLSALAYSKIDKPEINKIELHLSLAKENIEKIRSTLDDDRLRQQYFALQKAIYELEISTYMRDTSSKENLIQAIISAENFRSRTLYESITSKNQTETLKSERVERPENKEAVSLTELVLQLSQDKINSEDNHKNERINIDKIEKNTAILYYFSGNEESYSWLITSDEIYSSKLPNASELALAVNNYSSAINRPPAGGLSSKVWEKLFYVTEAISEILVGPYTEQIKDYDSIIISPDGPLHRIPFSALDINLEDKKLTYLSSNHNLSYTPSLRTYDIFKKNNDSQINNNSLLLVSNPTIIQPEKEHNFAILPSTVEEAETITNLWKNIGPMSQLSNKMATKENLSKIIDKDFKIMHFATHALASWDYPGQSSIALSNINQPNGINTSLTIEDIKSWNLSSELVVLSACDTAVGKQIEGEGPIGLSRAFIEAGSKRVIASLWPIDDAASAHLMKQFYKNLITNNYSPSKALSQAQTAMRQDSKWSHPYYWSSFNLYGEGSSWN